MPRPMYKLDMPAHICELSGSPARWKVEKKEFLKFQGLVSLPYVIAYIKQKVRNDI